MKNKEVKLTIMGEPIAKGRPRFSKGHIYTPEKTANYEQLIKAAWLQSERVRFGDEAELVLEVIAYFSIPKNTTMALRVLMIKGEKRPIKRPDYDNIEKICSDALNGLAYKDDAQIVNAIFGKYYSEQPRLEILIHEL